MTNKGVDISCEILNLLVAVTHLSEEIAVNHLATVWRFGGDRNCSYRIHAPSRRAGLKISVAAANHDPELYSLLRRITEDCDHLSAAEVDRMLSAGLLTEKSDIGTLVSFEPTLDTRTLQAIGKQDGSMPVFRTGEPEDAPAILGSGPITWWFDRRRGIEWPFRGALPKCIPVTDDQVFVEASRWESMLTEAKRDLNTCGVAVIRGLLPECLLAPLQEYYRGLVANGHLVFGDIQSKRYNLHNEPLAAWLQQHTASLVCSVIPDPSRPAYSYLGFYVSGAELPKHKDRRQCEFTLSLTIQANAAGAESWPIHIELEDSTVRTIRLDSGDAVIFRGHQLPHYREPLAEGNYGAMFWCYVSNDFSGELA